MNKNTRQFHIAWGIVFLVFALVTSQVTTPKPFMHGVPLGTLMFALFAAVRFYVAWKTEDGLYEVRWHHTDAEDYKVLGRFPDWNEAMWYVQKSHNALVSRMIDEVTPTFIQNNDGAWHPWDKDFRWTIIKRERHATTL